MVACHRILAGLLLLGFSVSGCARQYVPTRGQSTDDLETATKECRQEATVREYPMCFSYASGFGAAAVAGLAWCAAVNLTSASMSVAGAPGFPEVNDRRMDDCMTALGYTRAKNTSPAPEPFDRRSR